MKKAGNNLTNRATEHLAGPMISTVVHACLLAGISNFMVLNPPLPLDEIALTVQTVEVKALSAIWEPPAQAGDDFTLVTRPDILVPDERSSVECVIVEQRELNMPGEAPTAIAMPCLLSVRPGNSALVLPGLYGLRTSRSRLDQHELVSSASCFGPSLDDFAEIREEGFRRVADQPLSTFSIEVDTASYSIVRRFLNEGRLPPKDAVRIEELVNYFPYDYPQPPAGEAFAASIELAPAPWSTTRQLLRIGIKGRDIAQPERPPCNLVFLIDVSGSMQPPNRLPLVKRAMQALIQQLDGRDHVAIVVYAASAGLVMPPTNGLDQTAILAALAQLEAGGSTAGGAGIQLAYQVARENFTPDAVNRVILCTDGDFNVGVTSRGDLTRMVEAEAKSGVFLTVLGFGMGNFKDATLESLSRRGNGNYAYIDHFGEARKVLVDQMAGTLLTIAKDVKIQVEFNPVAVTAYRLLGYENRRLRQEDFNDDQVDAGEIGAGHTVTAFYELVLAGNGASSDTPGRQIPKVDALKYQHLRPVLGHHDEWLTVKIRHKQPDGDTSRKLEFPLAANRHLASGSSASAEFRFAAAVASFGMLLRGEHLGEFSYDQVIDLADNATGDDRFDHRREFLNLVRNAKSLSSVNALCRK